MSGLSRRALLGRGAIAAGAAAVPGSLVAAGTALAQDDAETEALERLIELERAAELGFSLAAEESDLSSAAKALFEEISDQNGEHATALEAALDSLGVDPPEAQSDQGDYEALADLDLEAKEGEVMEFLAGLEGDLLTAYEEETLEFESADLFRTAAQVGASHAQHLAQLALVAGGRAVTLDLPDPSTSATASDPDDTDSE